MFPNPETANSDGLVAIGGDLSEKVIEEAYTHGIFPWPQKNYPLMWFSPPKRGILYLDKAKAPKVTRKKISQNYFDLTFNKNFSEVIQNCSRIPRNNETGTWIIPEMVTAYEGLHKKGLALSVEAWQSGELVGGLYGVLIRGVFSGESMFFKKSEASKVCLLFLINKLKAEGHTWIDIQMVTPLLKKFGGEYIPRQEFLNMLKNRHKEIL